MNGKTVRVSVESRPDKWLWASSEKVLLSPRDELGDLGTVYESGQNSYLPHNVDKNENQAEDECCTR